MTYEKSGLYFLPATGVDMNNLKILVIAILLVTRQKHRKANIYPGGKKLLTRILLTVQKTYKY